MSPSAVRRVSVVFAALLASAASDCSSIESINPIGTGQSPDWPMYGRNVEHTFATTDAAVNSANIATLRPAWSFPTGDAVSAVPTVVGGAVYVGAWDGFFYALDAATGALKWRFQVACQNAVLPIPPQCLPAG